MYLRRSPFLSAVVVVLVACGVGACRSDLPDPDSPAYQEAVTAFYTGLAAVQAGTDLGAEGRLLRVTELAPGEPAAWANLGLLAARRNDVEQANAWIHRALSLAPDNSDIHLLAGLVDLSQTRYEAARASLERAVVLDSTNLYALFALGQTVEASGGPATEALVWIEAVLALRPQNLAALVEAARLAALGGDAGALQRYVARLAGLAEGWPPEAREQLAGLQDAAGAGDLEAASVQVAFLKNVLLRFPPYQRNLAAVKIPVEMVGDLITRFVRLPAPRSRPWPADDSLALVRRPIAGGGEGGQSLSVFFLNEEGAPDILIADARAVTILGRDTLAFPGGAAAVPPTQAAMAGLDYDSDFRMDLAFAGAGGLRLYRQDSTGAFTDVTGRVGLSAAVTAAPYTGAWAADLDLEGDMDLVLGTPEGPPRVLRNNGDGTFTVIDLFGSVDGLRGFAWADLDADGDPDAAVLDRAGAVHVFTNQRSALFEERALPPDLGRAAALAVADLDRDALIDLAILRADGAVEQLSDVDEAGWRREVLVRWTNGYAEAAGPGQASLGVHDLDNNGSLDLLAATPQGWQLWLSDPDRGFIAQAGGDGDRVLDVSDLSGEGRLDLVALADGGVPVSFGNFGVKPYHWKRLRLRAAETAGDQRINAFGIGGEVEVRAGLLYQKQPIQGPEVHFGLGESLVADVVRIIWPNGSVQAEFDLLSDEVVSAQQRLKGSCPWVFTYDGTGLRFVTDFLWRSPLGLRINAQETAGIAATEDWVLIRGDELVPRDGRYDVRITAELWETHFFDHVSLMAVDHPAETEVLVDERFVFPPPALQLNATTPVRPIAGAWDDRGRDVTARVQAVDAQYLDAFGRGQYQGVTRDHYVEVDLGDGVPDEGPLVLTASGWIRPTDSSINVALGQGGHAPPQGLRLEVPDGAGGWRVAEANLGFPSGKLKTILVDLEGVFEPGTPRRLRLATNLEVYWDAFGWALRKPGAPLGTHRLLPDSALLRYRGYSVVNEADRSSPELPDYDRLQGTVPVWRDLVGYYTRHGDVGELLTEVDDRYVIMNAGDELVLTFPVPAPPPEGWTRDFVLIGDGWVKDGDYNTTFSKTVLPLPMHGEPEYTTPPGRLEDDPVYRRHPEDWQHYHTRYLTPRRFHDALVQ